MIGFIRNKILKLGADQRGVVAAMIAIGLTFMVGLTSAAIDLGLVYNARSELQNAADAAALAAANTMVTMNGSQATATPDTALATAKAISLANEAIHVSLTLLDQDFTIGFWDTETGAFDPTRVGFSTDPDDLTAVTVTLRRDGTANGPVSTYFAGIFGIDTVNVAATATAFLGYPGSVPGGIVDLPIAVLEDKVADEGGPNCGEEITFSSENTENGEWTTFFINPASTPIVDEYITGDEDIPPISIGDDLNVINGNLSANIFNNLLQRFNAEKGMDSDGDPNTWTVTLPVVDSGDTATFSTVTGFMQFTITEVLGPPDKLIRGVLHCGGVIPDSGTGGTDYGSRAANSILIR